MMPVRFPWLAFLIVLVAGCSRKPAASAPAALLLSPAAEIPQRPPEAFIEEAQSLAATGDLGRAIETLEQAVLVDPTHRKVLLLLVEYSQKISNESVDRDPAKGYQMMVKAAGYLREFKRHHSDPTEPEKKFVALVFFDEARAHGRSNRHEETMAALRDAIASGFRDFNRLHTEPDLDNLRDVPAFKKLLEEHPAENSR